MDEITALIRSINLPIERIVLEHDCLIEGEVEISSYLIEITVERWMRLLTTSMNEKMKNLNILTYLGLHIRISDILSILEQAVAMEDRVRVFILRAKLDEISQIFPITTQISQLNGALIQLCDIAGTRTYGERLCDFLSKLGYGFVEVFNGLITFHDYTLEVGSKPEDYEWSVEFPITPESFYQLPQQQDYAVDDKVLSIQTIYDHLQREFGTNSTLDINLRFDVNDKNSVIFGVKRLKHMIIVSHPGLYRMVRLAIFIQTHRLVEGEISLNDFRKVTIRSDIGRGGLEFASRIIQNQYNEMNQSYYGDGSLARRGFKDTNENEWYEINEFLSYKWEGEWKVIRDRFLPIEAGRVFVAGEEYVHGETIRTSIDTSSTKRIIGGRTLQNEVVVIDGEGKNGKIELGLTVSNSKVKVSHRLGEMSPGNEAKWIKEFTENCFKLNVINGIGGIHSINAETALMMVYSHSQSQELTRIICKVLNTRNYGECNTLICNVQSGKVINCHLNGIFATAVVPSYTGIGLNLYSEEVGIVQDMINCHITKLEGWNERFDTSFGARVCYKVLSDPTIYEKYHVAAIGRRRFLGELFSKTVNSKKGCFTRTRFRNGYAQPQAIIKHRVPLVAKEDGVLSYNQRLGHRELWTTGEEYLSQQALSMLEWKTEDVYALLPLYLCPIYGKEDRNKRCFGCGLHYQLPLLCQLCRDCDIKCQEIERE